MTYLAPVAPPVPVSARDHAPAILAVAEALQPDLAQGFQIDALRLRLEMERAFGGSDADGAWNWKLAYEAGEVALVLFLRMRSLCPIEIFGLSRLTLGWGTVRLGAHPGVPGELMCGDLAAV